MGRIVKSNQPCEYCGSKDNRQLYDDGSSYCFSLSCSRKNIPAPKEGVSETFEEVQMDTTDLLEIEQDYPVRGFKDRGIYKTVAEHYGVKCSYDFDGEIDTHYYPFYDNTELTGYKVRKLPKTFHSVGKVKGGLFGMNLYNGGKRLVITEGECDAMAVQSAWYKRYKTFYPVVSLRSSSSTNDLIACRDWVRNFDEVVLWLDKDDAGQTATKEAARIIEQNEIDANSINESAYIKEMQEKMSKVSDVPKEDENKNKVEEAVKKLTPALKVEKTYTKLLWAVGLCLTLKSNR